MSPPESAFGASRFIPLATAEKMIAAAREEAARQGWKVAIAVVDAGGHLLGFQRMDGTQLGSIAIAIGKAQTAVKFMRPTRNLEDIVTQGKIGFLAADGILPLQGGLPVTVDGAVVGGVGVSGATSAQDEQVAAAALAVLA